MNPRRKSSIINALQKQIELQSVKIGAMQRDVKLLSKAWELQFSEIELEKHHLAKGAYGQVWKGVYMSKYDVAVKIMYVVRASLTSHKYSTRTPTQVRH